MTAARFESGQVAVVTGAARGIGFGIAKRLAQEGLAVALLDRDAAALDDAVASLAREDFQAIGVTVDLTDSAAVDRAMAEVVQKAGRIDHLVNNAGAVRDMRFLKMSDEDWDLVIDTNLRSQFLCCRAVLPGMIEGGHGRIVNISSRAWLGGFGQANYSAAKGGVVSFTRTMAIELAKHGITANAIAPGAIDTPILAPLSSEQIDRIKGTIPVGRLGQPEDIAHAVLMFAAPEASYITGQTIYVCGGRSLSSPSV